MVFSYQIKRTVEVMIFQVPLFKKSCMLIFFLMKKVFWKLKLFSMKFCLFIEISLKKCLLYSTFNELQWTNFKIIYQVNFFLALINSNRNIYFRFLSICFFIFFCFLSLSKFCLFSLSRFCFLSFSHFCWWLFSFCLQSFSTRYGKSCRHEPNKNKN